MEHIVDGCLSIFTIKLGCRFLVIVILIVILIILFI